jgi:2-polyprenyl-6-methoxyphenol hydroxylase-like FAD-dependent oxidoreductase
VLGAGPTGLEAAFAALERGWDVTVYEAAPQAQVAEVFAALDLELRALAPAQRIE